MISQLDKFFIEVIPIIPTNNKRLPVGLPEAIFLFAEATNGFQIVVSQFFTILEPHR
mgnify:CR=1 FL=1